MERLFDVTERAWAKLGSEEPYWSVVTAEQFKVAGFEAVKTDFFESAEREVEIFLAFLKRAGVDASSIQHMLEIGCGVGRMTCKLAKHCDRLTAVDISAPHISIARKEMLHRGIDNVEFVKVSKVRDYERIRGFDAIFSFIALQHSPPPVIDRVLAATLKSLPKGGYAYFQLPTYIEGYAFSIENYILHTKGEMEMHCLPQFRVFELLRDFDILEVINDGSGGDYRIESTRFFARKR